jgi:3-phenylpropionate/trans-cinnamate dioxygenase ferredoxin reductase subunit
VGKPARYDALPWFWSEQGALRLQIAGLLNGCDTFLTQGDVAAKTFSVLGFAGGRLRVVESVNRPADHLSARRLLSAHLSPTVQEASDASFDLATYAKEALRRNPAPGEEDDR